MAATARQLFVVEDGCISVGEATNNVTYHSALNTIIVTTKEPAIKVFDVTSGSVLQKSSLSVSKNDNICCTYLPDEDKMVFSNSLAVGVRRDLSGMLLLDTALQTPVSRTEDIVRVEVPLAEASQLLKSLMSAELPGVDSVEDVIKELEKGVDAVSEATKNSQKIAKWATVSLEMPHNVLKNVCSSLVAEMKRLNQHNPGLAISSAISDRLCYLLPSTLPYINGGPVERALMYSEVARKDTFCKWPHMNYKWALPSPMSQAGFYHQPNASGDDRAMCFTCNVCLVCWEPTDEPWSEHERHSPSCPFVKGEHTQNVPLSVTCAAQPAVLHGEALDKIECLSTTSDEHYVASATQNGDIVVWNISGLLRKYCQFNLDPSETVVALKTGIQVDQPVVSDVKETSEKTSGHSASPEGAEGMETESSCSNEVIENGGLEEEMLEVKLHDQSEDSVLSTQPMSRPSDDVVVSSLCVAGHLRSSHKAFLPPLNYGHASKQSTAVYNSHLPLRLPSLVCGVSLRRTKFCLGADENSTETGADVQLMNKVNEVESGDLQQKIIPDSNEVTDDDLTRTTSFMPFIVVLVIKENSKKIGCSEMDSVKMTSDVVFPPTETLNMGVDLYLMDEMYDSDPDPDVQIVGVTPGPSPAPELLSKVKIESKHVNSSCECGQGRLKTDLMVKKNPVKAGSVLQCIELPKELQLDYMEIKSIMPTLDRQHIVVVVTPKKQLVSSNSVISQTQSEVKTGSCENSMNLENGEMESVSLNADEMFKSTICEGGSILIYKLACDSDFIYVEETPVVVRHIDSLSHSVLSVLILPQDISDSSEGEEEISQKRAVESSATTSNAENGDSKILETPGQIAVVLANGIVQILNLEDLSARAEIHPPEGDTFISVTFCTGIERLCCCSAKGKLHFYQFCENDPDQIETEVIEVDSTCDESQSVETDTISSARSEEVIEQTEKTSPGTELLAKQPLSTENLMALHNLIQFENLMPRFTATVPPCWSEIQQEQQQRRHPQHLQHQGEATQHTRTWKLQPDSNTWDEHLFEIVLPRPCLVGHVDVKFNLHPMCSAAPNIQVTLLKQKIANIGRQTSDGSLTEAGGDVDTKIEFNMKKSDDSSNGSGTKSTEEINNVLDPLFLESHNAEILCGPVGLSNFLDLSGSGGLISLSSPQLLNSKPRSFLLHIKGFPTKSEEMAEKSKTTEGKKKTSTPKMPSSAEKLKVKTINALFDNHPQGPVGAMKVLATSVSKAKVENLKGCDWLQEISVTIRKTKRTHLVKERMQRNAMIEMNSFHLKLLSAVACDDCQGFCGIGPDHCQNMALDILSWIVSIQMHDTVKGENVELLMMSVQENLSGIVNACFIYGTRTTAHKAARLLALSMECCKFYTDPNLAPLFSFSLLQFLLKALPLLACCQSSGALKWYFTLLNRVKVMDMPVVAERCTEILTTMAKCYYERSSPLHALLKARYGLYGQPFDPDLFDMELPQALKQVTPASTYTSVTSACTPSGTTNNNNLTVPTHTTDEIDFYDLFSLPSEKSPKMQMEYARGNVLGMLEVEPLHFSCHSTSDGTKMERMDTSGNGPSSSVNNSGMSGTINFGETIPTGMMSSGGGPSIVSMQQGMSSSTAAEHKSIHDLTSKPYSSSKHQNWLIKQITELQKNMLKATKTYISETMPPTPKTTPQVMTPPLTPPNEISQQNPAGVEKSDISKPPIQQVQKQAVVVPQSPNLFQPPAPQVLVIERMHSGARRFVILDFGKPILLTDVIIPSCGDLASLSIDVWVQGEEIDGQRLVVASDIGTRSLIMNDIMPPPVCRFLKITTIGRYGSGTTRSRIPIGSFYGHSYILPWEWNSYMDHVSGPSTSSVGCQLDLPNHSQLLSHLTMFLTLLEDIQCRYSLCRTRLEQLLSTADSLQHPSSHTQYFLKKTKKNDEDNSILQTYNDCMQLQLQQNLAQRAIQRLQHALGIKVPSYQQSGNLNIWVRQSATDKLRVIQECLIDSLLSMTSSSCIPQPPTSLYLSLSPTVCEALFKHLCLQGTRRIQIGTGILLVRVCGSQHWWGEFLGDVLRDFFHSQYSRVFAQDRVFVLLTAMGQKALTGSSSVCIMESLLSMLAKVLSPLVNRQQGGTRSHSAFIDLSLIGWILLFLCRNLDSTLPSCNGDEDKGGASKKYKGNSLPNRWNFVQAENTSTGTKTKSRSVKLYRRSLQKRLMHHKQKLMDLEQTKKNFLASQSEKSSQNVSSTFLKQQEKQFRKGLSQYACKHLKDIIHMRRTDGELLRRLPKEDGGSGAGREGDLDQDNVLVLPKEKCLPVVHGLMALLLSMDFTCNVDMFLVACKVLARICVATRPTISLTEAMSQEQLDSLILLCSSLDFNHGNISWGGPWARHAITCLLQDMLDGKMAYPSTTVMEGVTDDEMSGTVTETDDSLPQSVSLPTFEEPDANMDNSDVDTPFSLNITFDMDMLLDEGEYDNNNSPLPLQWTSSDLSKPMPMPISMLNTVAYMKPSMAVGSSMNNSVDIDHPLPGIMEVPEEKSKHVTMYKNVFKQITDNLTDSAGSVARPAALSAAVQGLSSALDSRLEFGLETQSELRLRVMLSLQTETVQSAFLSALPVAPPVVYCMDQSQPSSTDDELSQANAYTARSLVSSTEMLTQCYERLLSPMMIHRVNLDALLQLWLTLNNDASHDDGVSTSFDPSRTPQIPLGQTVVVSLLAFVSSTPSLPVRTWVLFLQSLTLLANEKVPSNDDHGGDVSMVEIMLSNENLMTVILNFLSGMTSSVSVAATAQFSQVGPSATKAFHEFLQRLQVKSSEEGAKVLKKLMLKMVYTLTAERGAIKSCLGPLDAQCKFLDFILEIGYDQVDISNSISVIESISVLVHQHILCQERVICRSSSENNVSARSCFGGLFASLLRGGDSKSGTGDSSRDLLMCSLLQLVNTLIKIQLQTRHGRSVSVLTESIIEPHTPTVATLSDPVTDTTKLSQALATSTPTPSMTQLDEDKCQTDEEKTVNLAAGNLENPSTNSNPTEPPCTYLSDIILSHRQIMTNFTQALSFCNSNTMAMLLGSMPNSVQDTLTGGEPLSVGDGIYQILITLTKMSSDIQLILESLFHYLSGRYVSMGSGVLCRLSEPLLWFILKVLDSARSVELFLEMGGVEVVCNNLVKCHCHMISTSPSHISTIMQNMNGSAGGPNKRSAWDSDSTEGLQNFAPLGSISSSRPTVSPADVLIQASPPHRRARSAAWSYHFYPDEAWVDLTITLPFAILLKEVQIQPHFNSLTTCPAYVTLEVSHDGFAANPVCSPMMTSSLAMIKLQLQKPEVATSVTIRLHKARDSMTIGLSQILLMGFSAFGESGYRTNNILLPTEDFVSRSSVGWIRLLYHCLTSQSEVRDRVAAAAAMVPNLLNTCISSLSSPIASVYAPNIETVLLKLGLHSGEMGLALIDNMLRRPGISNETGYFAPCLGKMSGIANESTVEILYQLGTVQDSNTPERIKALMDWLGDTARVGLQKSAVYSDDRFRQTAPQASYLALANPAAVHVHCIAAILWQSHELPVEYNLCLFISKELISSLYEWSTVLSPDCELKKALDYVLCSMCHIYPEYFTCILEWMGVIVNADNSLTASISDDRKDISHFHMGSMTDDIKEANRQPTRNNVPSSVPNMELPPITLQEFKLMTLDKSHLATLAVACQSTLVVRQLLDSGFPAVLAQGLLEFCNKVIVRLPDAYVHMEGVTDNSKSLNENPAAGGSRESMHSTQSSSPDKGLSITADMLAAVLRFFAEVASEPVMKDWLGEPEGNIFWPALLAMLCNTPAQSQGSQSEASHKSEVQLISVEERTTIETATVKFFSRVISCHVVNQMLFAKVVCDVIKQQDPGSKSGLCTGTSPLSGFTRQLFLQVLLEDEKILVALKTNQYRMKSQSSPSQLQHPKYGAGLGSRTFTLSIHTLCGELKNKVSDTTNLTAQLLDYPNEKKSDESKRETTELGLEVIEYLSNAAGVLAKERREKDKDKSLSTSKSSLQQRPTTRRGRHTADVVASQLNFQVVSICHPSMPNKALPSGLSLSQLLQVLHQKGFPQGQDTLELQINVQKQRQCNILSCSQPDDWAELPDDENDIPDELLLTSPQFPTALQVFASVGGLALLAEHLPVLYPEATRPSATVDTGGDSSMTGNLGDDWVTVESYPEDFYELYEPMSPGPSSIRTPRHTTGSLPTIPPHSLLAFGLFLRLPGYAEVLFKERKKAQCLLRLVLGVTDDGDGGHIMTSPLAGSLPTLPFHVLKSLFDASPLTTDDGVLLRRMSLDIGLLHLILACLSILSHHAARVAVAGFQQESQAILSAMQNPGGSGPLGGPGDDKMHHYWAKGTGFGTGSTTSSWDAEQALLRQKSEEEHVTYLLQVIASYINPGGEVPNDFCSSEFNLISDETELPEIVLDLLSQSCLVPAISSYLRNDSVLDMARHVPLYRSLLELLRAIAVCSRLVPLLLPLDKDSNGDSAAVGVLLEKMRGCVDTYASRLRSNKGKSGNGHADDEENEGLALLIPDIQETATIVHISTDRLKIAEDKKFFEGDPGSREIVRLKSRESMDERYTACMREHQFDTFDIVLSEENVIKFTMSHHYENNVKAVGEINNPSRTRRLAQEAVTLSTSLPLSGSSTVFVRCDEERLDVMKVLITGPSDTPYANGCFEFDVYFPPDYPTSPPHINLETTGNRTIRFNPNLYNDGKVCLSILNTWHGRPEEKWSGQTSSFLQVLVSIQSLILVSEPYFNEPGYERSRGTPSGTASSREYDANIRQATVKWAILEQIKSPSLCFKDAVHRHFWLKRHEVLQQCEDWIAEMEAYSSDKRTGRTITHSSMALKRHYNQLREEFTKMKTPAGLEELEDSVDSGGMHYSTTNSVVTDVSTSDKNNSNITDTLDIFPVQDASSNSLPNLMTSEPEVPDC